MTIKTKDNANYGQQVKREDFGDAYNPEVNGAEYLSTLTGAAFDISFANQRTSHFVMDDMDYVCIAEYLYLPETDRR